MLAARRSFIFLGALSLLLGGCTDDEPTAVPPTTVALQDPCALVKAASVEQTIGQPVRAASPSENDRSRRCLFETTSGTGSIEIAIDHGNETTFAQLREAYPDAVDAGTRADEDFWSDRLHTLVARKGIRVVTVSLNLQDAPANLLPAATDLADEVLQQI